MHLVELDVFQHLQRLLESRLALSGEAHDQVSAQGYSGYGFPYALHQSSIINVCVAAAHELQDVVVAGLEGEVEVLAHLV